MQAALKLRTTVLPGHRVDFSAPELPEGAEVEVFISLSEPSDQGAGAGQRFGDGVEFLDALPPVPRTPEEWAALDREFLAERDAWDR